MKGKITMETRAYYYGDGTDNVVQLTEAQANASNKAMFYPVEEEKDSTGETQILVKTNLTREEIVHYNEAADILNVYLETHTVTYNDMEQPMLRPVK
ncbi:gp042 [Rhodococcus phage ReqiPoco6]|uniref:Gp042 n=1 Tax=Rhodococcus phage ReqiPoco6 TaxID=691964 RepID=D4P7R0_9CAUD|nr:gp042 [Rhodococcus phage ReqiPoco6]ADD81040.1 gp042 [Rhodococcus phage ReqiPoco6]